MSNETELKPCRCARHNCEAVAMESRDLVGDWHYWVTCKHIIEPCDSGLSLSKSQIHELWNLRQEVARSPDTTQLLKDPNAVHLNMLRGAIATPSLEQCLHLHGSNLLNDMQSLENRNENQVGIMSVLSDDLHKAEHDIENLMNSLTGTAAQVTGLLKDKEELKAELEKAEIALRPFALRVFNDNGEMTVGTAPFPREVLQGAYFIEKRIRALLARLSAQEPKTQVTENGSGAVERK